MPQASQANNNPAQPDRDNDRRSNAGLWWIVAAGTIFLLALLFVSISLPGQTERAKFFTVNALSVLVLVAIAIQVYINRRQWDSMEKSLNIMRTQLEITDRPWLKFEPRFIEPLTFTDRDVALRFVFSAKNVGRSVAVNTTIKAKIVIPLLDERHDFLTQVLREQEEVCKEVQSWRSYVVFPDDAYTIPCGFILEREEVDKGRYKTTGFVAMFLVGCIDYQFVGHSRHHQTRFVYEVWQKDPDRPDVNLGLDFGKDVPLERLVLEEMFLGGDSAD